MRCHEAAPSLLAIEAQRAGSRVILRVVGEIDISSARDLERAVESAREADAPEIWLDLTETTFCDGRGLRTLLDLRARLLAGDRRLVLVCPPGPVRRLLVLTGTDREFDIR